jgi:pimeloyl-ACP methyl ester carboxylesterase
MTALKTDTVKVPGATLYYEVRGAGPVLLLICGGIYDAAGFAELAGALHDRYTVVTYDRRGNSRSPLDGPPEPQHIPVHADDAYRLLDAVGVTADRPAYVFGNSSGAQIALDLAVQHPEMVATVVAHEPPILPLLPDRQRFADLLAETAQTYATAGAGPAMQVFAAGLAMNRGDHDGDGLAAPPDPEAMARMGRNLDFFIGYEVPTFGEYTPDIEALRSAAGRVVLAAGAKSVGEPPNRAAHAVAERLGTPVMVFPGDHGGFGSEHAAFAETLHRALSG